ncbi:MAG: YceI family protein [Bacteroidetes bacterium]|nr:MAG: YceI family protein [Bacteroidota bacterium]
MNFLKTILLGTAVAFSVSNCTQAPKSDKAETTDAKKVDEKTSADAQEVSVNTKTSVVTWVGTKPTDKHDGTFQLKDGKLSVKDGSVVGGSFTIDINSLEVKDLTPEKGKAKLEGHLKDTDFFETKKFPTATFEITSVKKYSKSKKADDEKDKKYTLADPNSLVTGNLELKGVTKSITFPAKITVDKDGSVKAEAKFNIERTDWKLSYGADKSLGDKFINPTVHIGFDINAKK